MLRLAGEVHGTCRRLHGSFPGLRKDIACEPWRTTRRIVIDGDAAIPFLETPAIDLVRAASRRIRAAGASGPLRNGQRDFFV